MNKARWFVLLFVFIVAVVCLPDQTRANTSAVPYGVISPANPAAYPPDPTVDIPWSAGTVGVADIQTTFSQARSTENTQLGTSLGPLTIPYSDSAWNALSNSEKALFLINQERIARGIHPLHGVESNVTSVAQAYAAYLLANDHFDHVDLQGNDPWDRLNANATIGACHDFLSVAENLAVFVTSGNNIPLPVERSVYDWIYYDSASSWGHRHAVLWYPYNDNSGEAGKEGFLGIGLASGGPYQGPFSSPWNYASLVVMNVFDPCSTWNYGATTYAISGNIRDNQGNPLAGVAVSDGAGHDSVTNANGDYTLSGLVAGAYTLTPSLGGYTFSPPTRQVTVTNANVSGQDFTGTPLAGAQSKVHFPLILKGVSGSINLPLAGLWRTNGKAVEFLVTSDRTHLGDFTVYFTVEGCPSEYSVTNSNLEPIVNKQFNFAAFNGTFYASGTFNSSTDANGIVGVNKYNVPGCGLVTGESSWAATWQGAMADLGRPWLGLNNEEKRVDVRFSLR